MKNKSGFSVVELLVIIVVVAALAVVGYMVYDRQQNKGSEQSPVATDVSEAPQINSSSDLDNALKVLDQNNPATASNADSIQLDRDLSTF